MAESSLSSLSKYKYDGREYLRRNSEETVGPSTVTLLGDDFSRLSLAALTAAEYVSSNENFNQFIKRAKFPKYYSMSARMETYLNWYFKHQHPGELAKAGFFSTGEDDEVYCFYCGGRLYDWASNVMPWEEHALYFPRCEWLLQQKGIAFVEKIQSKKANLSSEKEVQRSSLNSSRNKVNSPVCSTIDMSILDNRIQSFKGHDQLFRYSVEEFAAAGFFFIVINNTIKCYMCEIEIYNWRDGFSPIEIHQKRSPTCLLVARASDLDDKETASDYRNKKQNTSCKRLNEKGDETPYKNNVQSIEDYRKEYDRLLSLYHWPVCPIVDRCDLAAAGFYWKDKLVSITVQCFACFGKVEKWKVGENPEEKHKLLYPSCPFLMGKETDNVAITHEQKNFALRIFSERDALKKDEGRSYYVSRYNSSSEDFVHLKSESLDDPLFKLAQYPQFYFEMCRLKSFISWPSHHCISLTTLAAAGFFSNDIEDQVTCFFCGGKLHQWEANDEPWEEHARNFPHCKWLEEQKGKNFVDNVQKKYGTSVGVNHTTQHGHVAVSTERKLGRGEVLPAKTYNKKKDGTVKAEYDLDSILKSEEVQVLVGMGFDVSTIKTVIRKRLKQGLSAYQDTEDLLNAIFVEDENSQTSDDNETKRRGSDPVHSLENQRQTENNQDDVRKSLQTMETEDTQNKLALLSQKLEKLEEKNLCKICVDGEVDVLFLPCKHLVVCKNCSEKLDECPICRSYIDEKVNVFKP